MSASPGTAIGLVVAAALVLPWSPAQAQEETVSAKTLFETNCSACHSLDLPRSQHLDRNNWEWVMEDMVKKFGCNWLTSEQQQRIIDYLVEHHGPQ